MDINGCYLTYILLMYFMCNSNHGNRIFSYRRKTDKKLKTPLIQTVAAYAINKTNNDVVERFP